MLQNERSGGPPAYKLIVQYSAGVNLYLKFHDDPTGLGDFSYRSASHYLVSPLHLKNTAASGGRSTVIE